MAVSSVGIGSGLDVEKIVTQMVELEKKPLETLSAKATVINAKISTYGQIKSLMDDLNTAARDLTLDRTWGASKVSSSGAAASGAMTGLAAAGSYNVDVAHLAQSQTSVTAKLDKDAVMGVSGVMRFTIGNLETKNFDLTVSASDSLQKVADKINGDSNISKSVIASVIKDSSGKEQLMIRARETGLDSKFEISVGSSVDANGDLLAFDSAATGNLVSLAGAGGITTTQEAKNAEIKLNGVELESNTNTFSETIPGLTISATAVGTSLLTISSDKDAVQASIQKFVDAYNAVNDLLSLSTKSVRTADGKADEDAVSSGAGLLQGDSSTVSLQNSLRMMLQRISSNATGAFTRLSDVGMQMQQGGKLTVDSEKMTAALKDVDSLKSLFAAKADGMGQGGGVATNYKAFTDELLAWEGALNGKTDALQKQLDNNSDQQDKVEARATSMETRLRAQYSALDVKMASLTALNSYVSQMVTTWNKSSD